MKPNNEDKRNVPGNEVLEERIERNRELFEQKLKSYRNYGVIVLALLTVFGITSINSAIKQIVRVSTTDRLDEILTEGYVEEKIGIRSQKTIEQFKRDVDNLTHEVGIRSQETIEQFKKDVDNLTHEIVEESWDNIKETVEAYTAFTDWEIKANDAFDYGDYRKAAHLYEKAIFDVPELGDDETRNTTLFDLYMGVANSRLYNGNYDEAMVSLTEAKKKTELLGSECEQSDLAGLYFLTCITQHFLGLDNSESENKLKQLAAQGAFPAQWLLDKTNTWCERSGLDPEKASYINRITSLCERDDTTTAG